jgi:hypothetical protein
VAKRPVDLDEGREASMGNGRIAAHWLTEPADVRGPEYCVYRYDMDARLLLQQESEMSH